MVRLGEYDREEWWDICRKLCPDMTREEYDVVWEEFIALKERMGNERSS